MLHPNPSALEQFPHQMTLSLLEVWGPSWHRWNEAEGALLSRLAPFSSFLVSSLPHTYAFLRSSWKRIKISYILYSSNQNMCD